MGCVCGKESVDVNGRKFKLLECLGEGGFSFVYLAEENDRARTHWAIKRIDCASSEEERRALNEVALHKKLSHPNILPCEAHAVIPRDRGNVLSQVVLVLPLFHRGTLADELADRSLTRKSIPESRVLRLFRGVCMAVREMHSLRPEPIAHRDLKPGNVLLSHEDVPVLMDLGSARIARVNVHSQRVAHELQDYAAENCSMAYRAPELFTVSCEQMVTEATDVWSLGCLLYALCYFKSPFDLVHERGDSVALAAQSGRVTIPEESSYSSACNDLIQWVMQVRPELRPTVGDIIDRIDTLLPLVESREGDSSSPHLEKGESANGTAKHGVKTTSDFKNERSPIKIAV